MASEYGARSRRGAVHTGQSIALRRGGGGGIRKQIKPAARAALSPNSRPRAAPPIVG